MPGLLSFERGLPLVDWSGLNRHLARTYQGRELGRAYRRAEQEFLRELARALNGRRAGAPRYHLRAGRNFDLLSSARDATLASLLEFAEDARRKILRALPGVAADDGHGAHVVLLFSSDREYRAYNARYERGIGATREAETVGFYTNEGFGHFAVRHKGPARTRRIVSHELVHACMQHLPAPDWLHEGTACMLERAFATGGSLPSAQSLPGKTRRRRLDEFWNAKNAERRRANRSDFYRGRGFYLGGSVRNDSLREDCFALAEGLVAYWYGRKRRDLLRLLKEAHCKDGGRAALKAVFPDARDPVAEFLADV